MKVLVNDHFRNALLPKEPGFVFYVHKNLISSGISHDPKLIAKLKILADNCEGRDLQSRSLVRKKVNVPRLSSRLLYSRF